MLETWLSVLARSGSNDSGEILKAFQTGVPFLRAKADTLELLPGEACGLETLDTVLDRLASTVPRIKKNILQACVHVVGADGLIYEREAELLRAVAETLDWAAALTGLDIKSLDGDMAKIQASLICLLKTERDLKSVTAEVTGRLVGQAA